VFLDTFWTKLQNGLQNYQNIRFTDKPHMGFPKCVLLTYPTLAMIWEGPKTQNPSTSVPESRTCMAS